MALSTAPCSIWRNVQFSGSSLPANSRMRRPVIDRIGHFKARFADAKSIALRARLALAGGRVLFDFD
jgi:hypothetical protein